MKLRRYVRPEMIKVPFDTREEELDPEIPDGKRIRLLKEGILLEMAELLAGSGRVGSVKKLYTDLYNREKKATTAIGGGIMMPHVRTMQAKELVIGVGVSPEGLDIGAMDEEPVHVVLSLVAPPHDDRTYLRVVKRIVELFADEGNGLREELRSARSPEDVVHAMSGLE